MHGGLLAKKTGPAAALGQSDRDEEMKKIEALLEVHPY